MICYFALLIMLSGALALFLPFILDACKNKTGGTIACNPPFWRPIFEYGFTITLMGVYTGLPLALAIAGLIFAIRDLFFRKSTSQAEN